MLAMRCCDVDTKAAEESALTTRPGEITAFPDGGADLEEEGVSALTVRRVSIKDLSYILL